MKQIQNTSGRDNFVIAGASWYATYAGTFIYLSYVFALKQTVCEYIPFTECESKYCHKWEWVE